MKKKHHAHNINIKVNFVLEHNISSIRKTRSCASWTPISWWYHQTETFSTVLALCVGNSPVTGEFPSQRPVTRSFDAFFDLRLNKRLSKASRRWWFETPSHPLWRHCYVNSSSVYTVIQMLNERLYQHILGNNLLPFGDLILIFQCQWIY